MKFSANLGFLWTDRPLHAAIYAAKRAGFDAVECHWPYDTPSASVKSALDETGLKMLGLNTRRGDPSQGKNGFSALPDCKTEAKEAIDEAIRYAREINATAVHVMAGVSSGQLAYATFCDNLQYACTSAALHDITILVEPLNRFDAPGYFLQTSDQAASIIRKLGFPNLKLMFDCYHIQIMEGDLTRRLSALLPVIGHIQIASVPDRGPPDHGEIDYWHLTREMDRLGWSNPIGAEYKSEAETDLTLTWMKSLRS